MAEGSTGSTVGCPPPQVYVVPTEPYGYIALSGLLLVLWVRALWVRRAGQALQSYQGSGPQGEEGSFKEFASALKGLGFKGPEIKARWEQVDPKAPLEVQVSQAVKAG
jgi:hypothetical protein